LENKKIPEKSAGLSAKSESFASHSVPTDEKIKKIEKKMEEEIKQEEIDESLSEIYQGDDGKMVDVKKMDIKKKHGFFFWFFMIIFFLGLSGAAGYGAYYLYMQKGVDEAMVEFSIDGKTDALAGEEFNYAINYKNTSNVEVKNVKIEAEFPKNFRFIESEPAPAKNKNLWQIDSIPAHRSGVIRLKGALIGPVDEANTMLARISYMPVNFSSEFKKDASIITTVKDIGINFVFTNPASALAGDTNEVVIKFTANSENAMKNFLINIESNDNIEYMAADVASGNAKSKKASTSIDEIKPGSWQVNGVSETEQELKFSFKFKDKLKDQEDMVIHFEQKYEDAAYRFLDKTLSFEVVKNNLNLTLILNGSRDSGGIDFGQALNYSLVYANKGESEMKDVVIMAVLNGDLLDWASLNDQNKGQAQTNAITWSKEEIPGLASVGIGQEGTIDFSINVSSSTEIDINKSYEIKSYAQFLLGGQKKSSDDMKSNTIISKLNSDTNLKEQVKYFNDDNIAVGSGPLPPKVGQTTSFKVYWTVSNNLHELNDLKIETKLPPYAKWEDKNQVSAGTLQYIAEENKVVWNIGRLPISVPLAEGEFTISITPTVTDVDKIMVLLNGTNLSGTDSVTKSVINKINKAKTTKLEDDTIAENDGIVVE
jgi:uncharacterized repeat protein (TIGR01451 family)